MTEDVKQPAPQTGSESSPESQAAATSSEDVKIQQEQGTKLADGSLSTEPKIPVDRLNEEINARKQAESENAIYKELLEAKWKSAPKEPPQEPQGVVEEDENKKAWKQVETIAEAKAKYQTDLLKSEMELRETMKNPEFAPHYQAIKEKIKSIPGLSWKDALVLAKSESVRTQQPPTESQTQPGVSSKVSHEQNKPLTKEEAASMRDPLTGKFAYSVDEIDAMFS